MKMTKIALAIATAAMVSTPVLATNGDVLIGLGAQSRAMGGTGVAAFYGAENALVNPAMVGKSTGTEFSIGGTLFKPDVKASTNVSDMTGTGTYSSQTSDNDTNIIPEVAMSTRINESLTFGLGMFGSAGMGVDYRDNGGYTGVDAAPGTNGDGSALFNGYSNLQLMKFAPTLAFNKDNFGIGFAPVIQYGSLDINYKAYTADDNQDGTADDPDVNNIGNGMSTDLGLGFNLGGYFDVSKDLTIAASYQSAIAMEYKDQISVAAGGFGLDFSDKLEQPAEIKIGAAYTMGNIMLTADAKQIKWGDAEGYKDFNWEDQNVFSLGAKYTGDKYWLGAGYNFGSDPIKDVDDSAGGMAGYTAQATNMFNNHFFPGVVESHVTFGGGYSLSKNTTIEGAVVYAPEVTKTIDTSLITDFSDNGAIDASTPATSHTVNHSQVGYSVSVRMNF
jgi:long-chain fatty acid transport protein